MNDKIPPPPDQCCPYCSLKKKGPHTTAPETPETQYAMCPQELHKATVSGGAVVPIYPIPFGEGHGVGGNGG